MGFVGCSFEIKVKKKFGFKKMSLFTRLFSFPMKENLPINDPLPGIYLPCVDPEDCRDTRYVQGIQKPRPVIYGASSVPPGFVFHDETQCPVPRFSTFQSLEEFYNQDFLQTFTDCLKSSDFSTRGAKAMGFSATRFFEGSSVDSQGNRVTASLLGATIEYPYECCMQPSFYVANIRGQRNTQYYNPLFTTVHDFNCFKEDGCVSGGSLRNVQNAGVLAGLEDSVPFDFPKASPRSVMWYMQHAIATVNLDHLGSPINFWENGIVGKISAIGGTINLGGLPGTSGESKNALGGNAALFSAIRNSFGATDTPSQAAQKSYGVFSCPTTDGSSVTPTDTWQTSLMYPVPNDWEQFATADELDCCTRGVEYTNAATTGVNTEGGQGLIPQNLDTFLSNAETQTTEIEFTPLPPGNLTCSNYHCFESPYCQSLLARACKDFNVEQTQPGDFKYGGHCTRWRNWASNNYAALQPLPAGNRKYPPNSNVVPQPPKFPPTNNFYPSGAYPSSVDQSVFTLIDACSSSQLLQPQPQEIMDQCRGLLSATSLQTQFPRLRPITFDTPINYSSIPVTPYIIDFTNNKIDILLTYTQYKYFYPKNPYCPRGTLSGDINNYEDFVYTGEYASIVPLVQFLLGGGDGVSFNNLGYYNSFQQPFLIIPQIENFVSVTSITLDNFVALSSESFYEKVRANFNLKLNQQLGNFNPSIPNNSFTANIPLSPLIRTILRYAPNNQAQYNYVCTPWPNAPSISNLITPAFINHSTDFIVWDDSNSLTVIHTLTNATDHLVEVPLTDGSKSSADDYNKYIHRLENLTYLYNPANVIWNSVLDFNLDTPVQFSDQYYKDEFWSLNADCGYDKGGGNGIGFTDCWQFLGTRNASQGYVLDQNNNFIRASDNLSRYDDRLTVVFNTTLSNLLGLTGQGGSVTVNLNPMRGSTPMYPSVTSGGIRLSIPAGTGVLTFSSALPLQSPSVPIPLFNLTNSSQFWLTNTTPIPIYSLSVLNYSDNGYSVTFVPPSNQSSPFLPGTSVSVNIVDPTDPDNSGSFSAVPMLFYDGGIGGWQNNFNSPDFPVLGGFMSGRGIDIASVNSYGSGERFSSHSSDTTYELGEEFQGTISTILTYYKNQNVYSTGEANSGGTAAISQMFLSPII